MSFNSQAAPGQGDIARAAALCRAYGLQLDNRGDNSALECVHGDPADQFPDDPATDGPVDLTSATINNIVTSSDGTAIPKAPCVGPDATVGKRIQVLYGYYNGFERWGSGVVNTIRDAIARTNYYLDASTALKQDIRWYCANQIDVTVTGLLLSDSPTDGQGLYTRFDIIQSAKNSGYTSTDRIYLIFADPGPQITKDSGGYCGTGAGSYGNPGDDVQGSTNPNNSGPRYSIVSCWDPIFGYPSSSAGANALHEVLHGMGAVQRSAPHSSGDATGVKSNVGHCWDARDVMCYRDDGSYYANGGTLQTLCSNVQTWWVDCHHDDYYDPQPPHTGTYIDTHWNIAFSPWVTVAR